MKWRRCTCVLILLLLGSLSLAGCRESYDEATETLQVVTDRYRRLTLDDTCRARDPVIDEIEQELAGDHTVLSLLKLYVEGMKQEPGTDSRYFRNLEHLFACGTVPEQLEGHLHGYSLYLKKGEDPGGEILNQIWGYTLGEVSPWEGKILHRASGEELLKYTGGHETDTETVFVGLNGFQRFPESPLNQLSVTVLDFMMNLKDATPEEEALYGYQKKGGLFIARKARSVYPADGDREVFQLNYRWQGLGNTPPSRYLVDEVVEIADGLYLGRLVYATEHLVAPYDPLADPAVYGYEHFGFFILMDEGWRQLGIL
ncbi:hypothetical protein GF1_12610 [Desulfolithobacter dissulfuricans]|uniref:Uncharacterized protein n=1 Tax=Desulfolithobacter dissulfuricans TaxID=2795293 RepID=A0A915U9Y7_9BACT|nr:hypothetical protein [Desulfolithobacter dissulfuricans]BCO08885.1 hypothetical protein GF1_12610 [Desulfolithobacter dissulfuricans]